MNQTAVYREQVLLRLISKHDLPWHIEGETSTLRVIARDGSVVEDVISRSDAEKLVGEAEELGRKLGLVQPKSTQPFTRQQPRWRLFGH